MPGSHISGRFKVNPAHQVKLLEGAPSGVIAVLVRVADVHPKKVHFTAEVKVDETVSFID